MRTLPFLIALAGSSLIPFNSSQAAEQVPKVPRFSIEYMDQSVAPEADFFHYAAGTWIKNNPVPQDKSRWASFTELQERNWFLIHEILESTCKGELKANSPEEKVRDFYRSAIDTNRLEQLGFKPLEADLKRIETVATVEDLFRLLAGLHERGVGACFGDSVAPDAKNSEIYAFQLSQGGLGLPDRDYYLTEAFARQREAYVAHVAKMLGMIGEEPGQAKQHSATILELETALAKASKSRVDLRDPNAKYHQVAVAEAATNYPHLPLRLFLAEAGLEKMSGLIMRQPEFFAALDKLAIERPLAEWKTYLRCPLVRANAPYLDAAAEEEAFAFYGKVLRDQQVQEPRWQRSARAIDAEIGEALGQLFVEKHFPPAARARMVELVGNLRDVFRDRLQKQDWMSKPTRTKALAKFERFTQKIGHPDKVRDYSTVPIRPDDFFGNVQRAERFESRRQLARVGKPVD